MKIKPPPDHYCVIRGVPKAWTTEEVARFTCNALGLHLGKRNGRWTLTSIKWECLHPGHWVVEFDWKILGLAVNRKANG